MNRIRLVLLTPCVAAALLCSCANPINARTARGYYESGVQAERAGDLALACNNFSRAYGNARMGDLGPATEASYLYEYARVIGYTGNYAESEKSFLEVLALIEKAGGEADQLRAPTLAEYSRLLHDTGQHQKAVPIYQRAVTELEKTGIERSDPLGFAAFLDEYAQTLMASGLLERATTVTTRSAALKAEHKSETPRFHPRRYKN